LELLEALSPEITKQIWRVTVLTWKALCAALFPVALRDIPAAVARYIEHLGRTRETKRPRSKEKFMALRAAGAA
jgi:hypothetical protein